MTIGVRRGIGRRNREYGHKLRIEKWKGGTTFEEGEDPMGYFVDGKVFADVSLRSFPQEGAFGGVELARQGPVGLGGPESRPIGHRFV